MEKKIFLIIAILLSLVFCTSTAFTQILYVPAEFPTIQAAINSANEGDTIIVSPGTYHESLLINKNITLISTDPYSVSIIEGTIISGNGGSVVTFSGNETPNCILKGFYITGGNSNQGGGGINGKGTKATIANCYIMYNSTSSFARGGGIYYCNGLIANCMIAENYSGNIGGGLCLCGGEITGCIIVKNKAYYWGGAVSRCNANISNCTIVNNTGGWSQGGLEECTGRITNCIMWGNSHQQLYESSLPSFSCVQGVTAGEGNINVDPQFVNSSLNDYTLMSTSPCIDSAADTLPDYYHSTDINGKVRFLDGNGDGMFAPDMGAYEYGLVTGPFIWTSVKEINVIALVDEVNLPWQNFSIWNAGIDTLNWRITEDCNWLEVSPSFGSSTGQADEVTLYLNKTGLGAGKHTCGLSISDINAAVSPIEVTVNLYLYEDKGSPRYVPIDCPTIQIAIDLAHNGDVIIVEPGIYEENINFKGKNITLTSTDPLNMNVVASTVIDGKGKNSIVTFAGTESSSCKLTGFTITGGHAYNGGGIQGNNTYATISHCIIQGNNADYQGGGIDRCKTVISYCKILENYAGWYGGGCHLIGDLSNCLLASNSAGEEGGGIMSCGKIFSSTVVSNIAYPGSGLSRPGDITNSIIWNNILYDYSSVTYSCFAGASANSGNISSNPMFLDPGNGDYRLDQNSPCVDAGHHTWPQPMSLTDLDGNFRQIDGNNDRTVIVDMGCYEFGEVSTPLISAQPSETKFISVVNGADPNFQILEISNIGVGILNWRIVEDCNWVSVFPASGSCSTGQTEEVVVMVDNARLQQGRYTSYLTVFSDTAGNSPVSVPVTLIVHGENLLRVPSECLNIKEALDEAGEGYTVMVEDGTYTGRENTGILFPNKELILCSENGFESTVIDCNGADYAFIFDNIRPPDGITIRGFKICNSAHNGLYCIASKVNVEECWIVSNKDNGIYALYENSSLNLKKCIISANNRGIFSEKGTIELRNCIISGNTLTSGQGSAITGGSSKYVLATKIINCTVVGNRSQGAAIFIKFGNNSLITNSIITDNWPGQLGINYGTYYQPKVTYNNIEGGYSGIGNINVDPCFVEPGYWADANGMIVEPNHPNAIWVDGDYHLQSEGWSWDVTRHMWLYDDVTSRCVDAGNPGYSLGDELLSVPFDPYNIWGENLRIDMGSYGGTDEASIPPYGWTLLADLTNDGIVNFSDFSTLASSWMSNEPNQPGDLDRDSLTKLTDLDSLAQLWLEKTTWYK